MRRIKGDAAGENFIAITDPGSLLENLARESRFRDILPGVPEIGGRYSALSNFGIVPAAIMGVNVEHLLYRAERMRHSCDSCIPPEDNPGVVLGVTLGEMAKQGRDKVTFITSPAIGDLGAWLEQLIAESTGKEGKGIVPIDDEWLGPPEVYGRDRLFAYIRYTGGADPEQDKKVAALEKAGHPVIRIELSDLINLGEEFFLWEIATAVAGSILGINAFDQPNVQESKDYTRAFLEEFKKNGRLSEEKPILVADGIRIFGDDANRKALEGAKTLSAALAAHLARVKAGDYVALNAYVERNDVIHKAIQGIRLTIRDEKRVATTLGYGPRFLHSTGQLHKGGPNSGVFIQITSDDAEDLPIPGEPFTFGVLKAAQARGDFLSLSRRHRRALRVHLGSDVDAGLSRLQQIVDEVL
jgi:transaldolase/glucose-6-phosphate isomerase